MTPWKKLIKVGEWMAQRKFVARASAIPEWQYQVFSVLGLSLATNILAARCVGPCAGSVPAAVLLLAWGGFGVATMYCAVFLRSQHEEYLRSQYEEYLRSQREEHRRTSAFTKGVWRDWREWIADRAHEGPRFGACQPV